jgi:hypothetical protein
LVHHTQPSAQENECQQVLGQYEPNVGVHNLAGTSHLADDISTGTTDTTPAYPRRSSLSLFVVSSLKIIGMETPMIIWNHIVIIQLLQEYPGRIFYSVISMSSNSLQYCIVSYLL